MPLGKFQAATFGQPNTASKQLYHYFFSFFRIRIQLFLVFKSDFFVHSRAFTSVDKKLLRGAFMLKLSI